MWAALTLAAVFAQPSAPDEPPVLPPTPAPPVVAADPNEPPMLPPDAPVPVVRAPTGPRRFFPLGLGVGGALLGVGAAFLASSETTWQRLVTGPPGSLTILEADAMARTGKMLQIAAAAFLVAGSAVVLTGLGFLLFGTEGDRVALSVGPTGVAAAGRF